MLKIPIFIALLVGVSGCYAATRSTVDLVEAEQSMAAARAAGAPERAVYAWTMADEYMKNESHNEPMFCGITGLDLRSKEECSSLYVHHCHQF